MKEDFSIHSDLILRAVHGEEDAYAALYQLYARSMLNTAFRIVGDRDDAEDVLQDAFISAFRHLPSFRGESTFGAWLKRIVVHKSVNALNKRRTVSFPEGEMEHLAAPEPDAADVFPYSVEEVIAAVSRLPDGYRAVFSLYLLEGYDHEEISEILSISESTSKSQLNRAKRKLIEILKQR